MVKGLLRANTLFGGDSSNEADKEASAKSPIGLLPVYGLLTVY